MISSSGQRLYYNSKHQGTQNIEKDSELTIKFTEQHLFAGDVTLELKEDKSIGKNLLISYMFNTAFIDVTQTLRIMLQEMSPLGKQKQNNFNQDFHIDIDFRKVCECGEEKTGCQVCQGVLK